MTSNSYRRRQEGPKGPHVLVVNDELVARFNHPQEVDAAIERLIACRNLGGDAWRLEIEYLRVMHGRD